MIYFAQKVMSITWNYSIIHNKEVDETVLNLKEMRDH
jgi:hypothetical protein